MRAAVSSAVWRACLAAKPAEALALASALAPSRRSLLASEATMARRSAVMAATVAAARPSEGPAPAPAPAPAPRPVPTCSAPSEESPPSSVRRRVSWFMMRKYMSASRNMP